MSDKTSQFEEAQFTRILEVLNRERKAIALSRFHRWVFFLFSIVVVVNILLMITATAFLMIPQYLPIFSIPYQIKNFIKPFIISCFIPFFFLTPIMLLMNISLIRKVIYQRHLWQQLGLKNILKEKLQARRGLDKLLGGLFIIVGIIGISTVFFILYDNFLVRDRARHFTYGDFLMLSFFIGGAISFIALPFLRFGKEQLVWLSELASELTNLEDSLLQVRHQAREEGIESIRIAPADLKRLAVVEQSVIRQDRDLAISSFRQKGVPEYTILKSLESSRFIANLDLENRLRVEEEIQHLSEDPQAPESGLDLTEGFWRRPVPDTSIQILYSVDQAKRQVKIILLETLPGKEVLSAGNGGDRHA